MNFEPASQNGVVPPTPLKSKQSRFGLIASSTSSRFGQSIIVKALSDAAMYKTEPVTFYSKYSPTPSSTSTIVLGTSTFVDTVTAPFIVTNLGTGTHKIYASWPGEGLYAAQTTEFGPFPISVDASVDIGGQLAITIAPTSGSLVVGEGTATITAFLTTSTPVSNEVKFYVDNVQIGTELLVNNRASVNISSLSAGIRKITAEWQGAVISDVIYGGKSTQVNYEVLRGQTMPTALTLSVNKAQAVVSEGTITLTANINTATSLAGLVEFTADGVAVAEAALVNNTAIATVTNTFAVGNPIFRAAWNGNQTSTPKYIEKTSNTATVTIVERATIPSMSLAVTPNPAVAAFDTVTFTATLNTTTSVPGIVRFFEGPTFIASAPITLNQATVSLPAIGIQFNLGSSEFYATYAGSTTTPKYFPVTSNISTLTVIAGFPFTGTITLSASKPVVHQFSPLTLTATASTGTYTGVVNFDTSILDTRDNVWAGSVYNYPLYQFRESSDVNGRYLDLQYETTYAPQNFFSTGTVVKITAIADYTPIQGNVVRAGDESYFTIDRILFFDNSGTIPDYTFRMRFTTGTNTFLLGGDAPIEYRNNLIISPGSYTGNSQFGELIDEDTLASRNFNGTNSATYTFTPGEVITDNTQTHYFEAIWQGGYRNGLTPFLGTSSNVLTVRVVPAQITLSDTTTTNVITRPNRFVATVNTNSMVAIQLSLKDGDTVISTATTVGSTATFNLAPGVLSTGSRALVAEYSNAINTVRSNLFSQTVINKLAPTVSVSSSTYSFYNKNRTLNPVTTATIQVRGTGPGPFPTGVVTLLDSATGRLLGTASLSGTHQLSTATITWSPTDQSQIDQGVRNLRADYYSDDWYVESSGTNTFIADTKANISPTLAASQETIYWTNTTTFTMNLDGALPDGAIALKEGNTTLSVGTVSGNTATFQAQRFSTGTHMVFASLTNDTYVKNVNTNIVQITSNAIVTSFDNFNATFDRNTTIGQINWNLNPLGQIPSEFVIDKNITIKVFYRLNAPNNAGPDVKGPLWNTFIVPYTDTVNAFDMPNLYNDGSQLRTVVGYHFEVIYEGGGACPGTSKTGYVSRFSVLNLD